MNTRNTIPFILLLLSAVCNLKPQKETSYLPLFATSPASANTTAPGACTNGTQLPCPASLSGVVVGPTRIDLSWTLPAGSPSALVFEICRSTVSGSCAGNFTANYTTAAGATSHSLTDLLPSTGYHISIRATDGNGNVSGATPELTATTPAPDTTGTPIYSPAAGSYSAPQSVTLATATTGATICHTSTGATPSCNAAKTGCATGSLYTAPINVSSSRTVKAIACLANQTDSPVNTAAYTITAPPALYTVGGYASSVTVPGLVLQNNGGDDITVNSDSAFIFPTRLPDGSAFHVTRKTDPTGLTCSVTAGGPGSITAADVLDVRVSCVSVGGPGASCATSSCASGYICEADQICRGAPGTACASNVECQLGLFCAGTCQQCPAGSYLSGGVCVVVFDNDGDGYTSDVDCNDSNPGIHPGAFDIPGDGIDQDCSGADAALLPPGQSCSANAECQSGVCDPGLLACQ